MQEVIEPITSSKIKLVFDQKQADRAATGLTPVGHRGARTGLMEEMKQFRTNVKADRH